MRHRCFFFLSFCTDSTRATFFNILDSHDLTRLGSLYQSCFSEGTGTEFADCVENCTHINSLCVQPSEVPTIHRDGDRRNWHSVLWHSPLCSTSEESCKRKRNRQNAKKIGRCHAVPMGLNPMLHRSTCHYTYLIQDALGIKVKVTSVFLQTGLRIKHREESPSLSLALCPCLDMFVILIMIQTHLGHLGILPGHVLNNR